MPTVYLSPDPINSTQLIPGGVVPAAGGKLFHYLAGSSTKTDTYTDITGLVKWSNPIVLDSGGNLGGSNEVWIPAGISVKFVLAPFNDTDPPIAPYKTWDNLSGINDATSILTEWIPGPVPTFVSATSFTLVGDQTAIFTSGRRVKTTNTAGTRYGTISTSVFGAVTAVTITNDSGTLDAGLSAVWYALINPVNTSLPLIVSVLNFGAKGDGVTDDTAAIQAAVDSLTRGGIVGFPIGTYKQLGTVTISVNGVYLHAAAPGGRGVKIQFEPTSAKSAYKFANGASVLNYVGISGFEFASADTTFQKNCVEFVDCSTFFARDIICGSSGVPISGATSRGIYIRGREAGTIDRVQLYADAPIAFGQNPNASGNQIDHITLRDTYLVAPLAGSSPCVGAADATGTVSNFNTEGYNAWAGGSGGFQWVNSTAATATQDFSIKNVRWEQSTVTTAWVVDIESSTSAINNVRLENVYGGSGTKGYKFRGCNRITLANTWYVDGSKEALNLDSSCSHIIFDNFFAQSGSTKTMTGLSQVIAGPIDPANTLIAPFSIWEPTTNTNPILIGASGTETPFTATLTGCTTAPTGSVAAIRQGNTITLSVPPFTATSNAVTKTLTGMPAAFFPSIQLRGIFYGASDNGGAFVLGEAFVEANGVITLFPTLALGNWTNAGVFTSHRFSISYPATL